MTDDESAETAKDFHEANSCCENKDWKQAVELFRRVLLCEPEHEWALNNLGFALARLERYFEAEQVLRQVLFLNPKNARALSNLVMTIESTDDRYAAIDFRRRLAVLEPEGFDNLFSLANSLLATGCADEALHYFQRAIEASPDHRVCRSNYLLATNYSDSLTVDQVALEHYRHAHVWNSSRSAAVSSAATNSQQGKLRIGYLSSDFAHHPVGKIMTALLRQHDRSQVRIIGYSDRTADDAWTKRVQEQTDEFRHTVKMTDDQLVSVIRDDELSVLIELNGHTGGRNRLAALSQRVAPVQVSFLGYPNTTGVQAIDYFITDNFCDPPSLNERRHTEKLIRLKSGFLCFDPFVQPLPHQPSPCLENGFVTFGAFNNPAKASPSVVSAWVDIMSRVPNSVLVIKYGGKFRSEWLKNQWRARFAAGNISPQRLQFLDADPTLAGHYKRLAAVDLVLDTFPYQGTTTTLECLASGVPVLTRAGKTYCRRASSAILLRLGFPQLVTESDKHYVLQAVELSSNPKQLTAIRHRVQTEFPGSSVCDGAALVQELEATLKQLVAQKGFSFSEKPPSLPNDSDHIVVTCTGMPRSGSTWSYNVARRLLEHARGSENVAAQYREGMEGDQAVQEAIGAEKHQIIKLHYPQRHTMNAIRDGRVRNICTTRDPMMAVASFREMFGGGRSKPRLDRSGSHWKRPTNGERRTEVHCLLHSIN